ncbi:acyltransferase family protein [Paenibacillus sp. MMO-177]|uniref:acyltransferase family protein n=1 Tax=Paenibacillus sp. MMO-177 TaxID=3081289 RepID=UPI0030185560
MRRYEELDSLRGLAALTVVFSHFIIILNAVSWIDILNYTPLRILKAGHEAVIFFFVLSGFVLSLPFYGNKRFSYSSYIIKRTCRIYIPFLIIMLISILLYKLVYDPDKSFSALRLEWWTEPLTFNTVIRHLLLVPEYMETAINPVVWSLTQEMRISLIFPLVMIVVIRSGWRTNLGLALALSLISYLGNLLIQLANQNPISTNYLYTLHYIGMFIVGACLAKNREGILLRISGFSRRIKLAMLAGGLFFYTYAGISDAVIGKLIGIDGAWLSLAADWGITIGVVLLLICALSLKGISQILHWRPIAFLGKISYSLYLLHAVLLLTFIYMLNNIMPIWAIEIIVLITSLSGAYASYRLLEQPSMKLGRDWTTRRDRYEDKQTKRGTLHMGGPM